ncbi:hypothetical protein GCM10022245_42470 [Streptomyces mayteni]
MGVDDLRGHGEGGTSQEVAPGSGIYVVVSGGTGTLWMGPRAFVLAGSPTDGCFSSLNETFDASEPGDCAL